MDHITKKAVYVYKTIPQSTMSVAIKNAAQFLFALPVISFR
jgi:hypothetical protein